jgi:hypothetical protein
MRFNEKLSEVSMVREVTNQGGGVKNNRINSLIYKLQQK